MKNTRVVIVEDDAALRKSLSDLLSQVHAIMEYESAEAFLDAVDDFVFEDGIPTCMLLDFQMPGMNGVELQVALKQINIEFPIIFMSGNAHNADIIEAWRGGAVDFILKPFAAHQISNILANVFERADILRTSFEEHKAVSEIPITAREAQVLLLLGKGYQQTDVAKTLGLSLRTIKMYRTFLKNKLNLNTLIELARYCDKNQLAIKTLAGDEFGSTKPATRL